MLRMTSYSVMKYLALRERGAGRGEDTRFLRSKLKHDKTLHKKVGWSPILPLTLASRTCWPTTAA